MSELSGGELAFFVHFHSLIHSFTRLDCHLLLGVQGLKIAVFLLSPGRLVLWWIFFPVRQDTGFIYCLLLLLRHLHKKVLSFSFFLIVWPVKLNFYAD